MERKPSKEGKLLESPQDALQDAAGSESAASHFGVSLRHMDKTQPAPPTQQQQVSPPGPFGSSVIRRTLKRRPKDRPPSPPRHPLVKSGSMDDQLTRHDEPIRSPTSVPSPPRSSGGDGSPGRQPPDERKRASPSLLAEDFQLPPPPPEFYREESSVPVPSQMPPPPPTDSIPPPLQQDDKVYGKPRSLNNNNNNNAPPSPHLVSELFESLKIKGRRKTVEKDASSQTPASAEDAPAPQAEEPRKRSPLAPLPPKPDVGPDPQKTKPAPAPRTAASQTSAAIDDISKVATRVSTRSSAKDEDGQPSAPVNRSSDLGGVSCERLMEEDTKRHSTGSISSLRKLWENQQQTQGNSEADRSRLSPKIAHKRPESLKLKKGTAETQPDVDSNKLAPSPDHQQGTEEPDHPPVSPAPVSKTPETLPAVEKSNIEDQPENPTEKDTGAPTAKPIIPTKPPLKGSRPGLPPGPASLKLTKLGNKPQVLLRATGRETAPPPESPTAHPAVDQPNVAKPESNEDSQREACRASILEISNALETSIVGLKSSPSALSSSTVMQLSDKVQLFRSSCASYAESVPPHGRFRFRELLSKLESQGEQLRTCSGHNNAEKLFADLQNTVKDLVNVVQR